MRVFGHFEVIGPLRLQSATPLPMENPVTGNGACWLGWTAFDVDVSKNFTGVFSLIFFEKRNAFATSDKPPAAIYPKGNYLGKFYKPDFFI